MVQGNTIICDVCGEEIEGAYFEMPDGLIVCADSDCLVDWAEEYKRAQAVL